MDATAHTHQMAPHIVIAHYDETGKPALTQDVAPAEMSMGTLTGVASIWQSPAVATIPGQVGTVSANPNFAVPGQVKFGRSWIGPAKDGELDFTGMTSGPMIAGGPEIPPYRHSRSWLHHRRRSRTAAGKRGYRHPAARFLVRDHGDATLLACSGRNPVRICRLHRRGTPHRLTLPADPFARPPPIRR